MERIDVNVQTNEVRVIQLTPEEEAAAIVRAQEDAVERAENVERMVSSSLSAPVVQTLIDAFHALDTRVRELEGKQPVDRQAVANWLRSQYRTHV